MAVCFAISSYFLIGAYTGLDNNNNWNFLPAVIKGSIKSVGIFTLNKLPLGVLCRT